MSWDSGIQHVAMMWWYTVQGGAAWFDPEKAEASNSLSLVFGFSFYFSLYK